MRYDIIGDVHGCFDELVDLLRRLGHRVDGKRLEVRPGRQVVFVGDLVDRGPKVAEVLELVMDAAGRGAALVVRGNHDDRLALYLRGWPIRSAGSIDSSLRQLSHRSVEFQQQVMDFLGSLPPRLLLAGEFRNLGGGLPLSGVRVILNYGLNRVRFPAPVPVGSRLRTHSVLQTIEEGEGYVQFTVLNTIELEGSAKPACIAESVFRAYL